ncbi:transposase [Kineococcus sp. NBC_00420]|uniref:transposase n=1 Tax=Kineococcus sp. NBC_00420 TaxID=2903564 RepID=UPI002E1F7CE8
MFTQPLAAAVGEQVPVVAESLPAEFSALASLLNEAGPDVTAFTLLPGERGRKIWSLHPPERANRVVKHRTDVVGGWDLPHAKALLRLGNCVLIETHDEWQSRGRCSSRSRRGHR